MNRREFVGLSFSSLASALIPLRPLRPLASGRMVFVERWSWVMGQSAHIQLYAQSEDHGLEAAAAALAELRGVEAALSRFDDASDLSELNRLAGVKPVRVGVDLVALLRDADVLRDRTNGAFNLAIEPLMRAWGFRDRRVAPPNDRERAAARAAVAAAVVRLDGDRAFLPSREARLDAGGIGVGYGLDRAGAVLRAHGIDRALIDISGDLLALGAPPGAAAWSVGIAAPGRHDAVARTVTLRDEALATSSNRETVVRLGAFLAGHVMDPGAGAPAPRSRQVTVVAASGVLADALSTAGLVIGTNPGADRCWVDYLSAA